MKDSSEAIVPNPLPLPEECICMEEPTSTVLPALSWQTFLMPMKFSFINFGPQLVSCSRRSISSPSSLMRLKAAMAEVQSADEEAGDESIDDDSKATEVTEGDEEALNDDSFFSSGHIQVPGHVPGSGPVDILKGIHHQNGTCMPCASFYLEGSCQERSDSCQYCHLCKKQVAITKILEDRLKTTSHQVDTSNAKKWFCYTCNHTMLPGQSRKTAAFLSCQCIPGPPPWMHFSHQYATNDGTVSCLWCGGHSKVTRVSPMLRKECRMLQNLDDYIGQQTDYRSEHASQSCQQQNSIGQQRMLPR